MNFSNSAMFRYCRNGRTSARIPSRERVGGNSKRPAHAGVDQIH